jgi:hypothetical protein
MLTVNFIVENLAAANRAKPDTIYECLKAKLGREPTNAELNAECRRIIGESRKP